MFSRIKLRQAQAPQAIWSNASKSASRHPDRGGLPGRSAQKWPRRANLVGSTKCSKSLARRPEHARKMQQDQMWVAASKYGKHRHRKRFGRTPQNRPPGTRGGLVPGRFGPKFTACGRGGPTWSVRPNAEIASPDARTTPERCSMTRSGLPHQMTATTDTASDLVERLKIGLPAPVAA